MRASFVKGDVVEVFVDLGGDWKETCVHIYIKGNVVMKKHDMDDTSQSLTKSGEEYCVKMIKYVLKGDEDWKQML